MFKHTGRNIFQPYSIIKEGYGEIEILTIDDVLDHLSLTEFGSDMYDNLSQLVLDDGGEEELQKLYKIQEKLYTEYNKKGIINKRNNTVIDIIDETFPNNSGHSNGILFFRKDKEYLKGLEQKKFTISASSTSNIEGFYINVEELNLYNRNTDEILTYTGKIHLHVSDNELGFGIVKFLD